MRLRLSGVFCGALLWVCMSPEPGVAGLPGRQPPAGAEVDIQDLVASLERVEGVDTPLPSPVERGSSEIAVDLATLAPGETNVVEVSSLSFVVVLAVRAPAAAYRLHIKDSSREWVRDIRPAGDWMLREKQQPAPCMQLQNRAFAFLRLRDESEAGATFPSVRVFAEQDECKHIKFLGGHILDLMRGHVYSGSFSGPDERAWVRIERLDAALEEVEKTWKLEFRLQTIPNAWAFASEEEWIVGTVARDVVDMLALATGNAPPAGADWLTVTPTGTSWKLSLDLSPGRRIEHELQAKHIWEPSAYREVGQRVAAAWGLATQRSEPELPALAVEKLLEPTTATMLAENDRISRALQESPTSSTLHAEAALLLSTLASREHARDYDDVRGTLSRAAAHLAVAAVLRRAPEAGTAERVAYALLLSVARSQNVALAELVSLRAEGSGSPAVAAWGRAIRMRATGTGGQCRLSRASHCLRSSSGSGRTVAP